MRSGEDAGAYLMAGGFEIATEKSCGGYRKRVSVLVWRGGR